MSRPPIASIVGGVRQELCDMPWDEYLAYPALNGSTIVHGRTSMLHLKYAWDSDGGDSDALRFGRMLHTLLFEHSDFTRRYRAWDGVRRGKAYDEFLMSAAVDGAEVVPANGKLSLDAALAAAPSFLANAKIRTLIKAGQAEQTVLTTECGLQCKSRIDWISTSEHCLTDLKTTRDIDGRLFGASFFRYGYQIKLGLYSRWLNAVTQDVWPVTVIVLENHPPFDVAVMPIPQAVLDAGAEQGLRIIEKVAKAIEKDEWPGVAGDGDMTLHVPFYVLAEEETEDTVRCCDE